MNRKELLDEWYEMEAYNLGCYSQDFLMNIPKEKYKQEWIREQEKIELIKELQEEEEQQPFHLYVSIYSLKNEINVKTEGDLAYLEDRERLISCYLIVKEEDGKYKYILNFNKHDREEFDDEYDYVDSIEISKEAFKDRKTLKETMEEALHTFGKQIL